MRRFPSRKSLPLGVAAALLAASALVSCPKGNAPDSLAAESSAEVLVLYSYNFSVPGQQEVAAGMEEALEGAGMASTDLTHEFLDIAPPAYPGLRADLGKALLSKYAGRSFDLIVTVYAAALDFLLNEGRELSPSSPCVSVLAAPRPELASAARKVLQTPFRYDLEGTIDRALELFPATRRVLLVSGASPSNRAFAEEARRIFASRGGGPELILTDALSYEEILARAAGLPPASIVVYTVLSVDAAGKPLNPVDVAIELAAKAGAPVFSLATNPLGKGVIGGSMLDLEATGRMLGKTIADFAAGKDISVGSAESSITPMFDWRVVRKWRGATGRLPAGSVFINRPPDIFTEYKIEAIAVVAAFLALIVLVMALLALNYRRKQAELSSRESEAKLDSAARMAKLGYWEYDFDKGLFTFSDSMAAVLRAPPSGIEGRTMAMDEYEERFVPPESRQAFRDLVRRIKESDAPGEESRQLELPIVFADGQAGCVAVRLFVIKDARGRIVRAFGIDQDVTEQKLAKERLESSLAEKESLLRELYHRTKNNMGVINAILGIQAEYFDDERFKAAIAETQARIVSMALVHEKLYEAKDLSRINLKDYVSDLASRIFASRGASSEGIGFVSEAEDLRVQIDVAIPCGLILNELIVNSLKHAFPDGKAGTIRVALRREGDGDILLEVRDDGIGPPEAFDPRRDGHMGMQTIFGLAESQLMGRVEFSFDGGFAFRARFSDGQYRSRV